jgi:hypothetical protein
VRLSGGIAPNFAGSERRNPVATQKIRLGEAIACFAVGGYMSYLSLKTVLPAFILLGGVLVATTPSYGTAAYATQTKQKCTTCHLKVTADKDAMKANLTDAGKYFKDKKSLDGYVEKK